MFGIEKPLPMANEDTEAYWEACFEERLTVPRCQTCAHWFVPPVALCPKCLSEDVAFANVSGRGRVHSFIIVHRPQHPAFTPDAPYNVVIVELDEGPLMHSRLVEIDARDIAIGMEVEVRFEQVDDEIKLPLFKPRGT